MCIRTPPLPSARIVVDHQAIVKLHGSHYGLRADLSLDLSPMEDDRRNFISYLSGEIVNDDQLKSNGTVRHEVGVLVAGYGAIDERTRGLFKVALEKMTNLHIFWVCHTQNDRDWLNHKDAFGAELADPRK